VQAFVLHAADLRLIIAGDRLVGAIERGPAPGEWRTNFTLGGSRTPVVPPPGAVDLARAATRAAGGDLMGWT
jgi:glutathione synthase/RimK-type ligase-like ATP-grasp enzyme